MRQRIIGLFLCTWVLTGCFRPAPDVPIEERDLTAAPATQTAALPATETATEFSQDETPVPTAARTESSPLFPGLDLALEAGFPDGPDQANIYEIVSPQEPDVETAVQSALQLGVEGEVYREAGGAGSTLVAGNGPSIQFFRSLSAFRLNRIPAAQFPAASCTIPCLAESASGEAENFLKNHQLLDFEYRVFSSQTYAPGAEVVQLLEGRTVITPERSAAGVTVNEDGELIRLDYRPAAVAPARSAPLRSAEQAWQALIAGESGAVFHEYPAGSPAARSWARRYPPNGDLKIFGYAQVFEPQGGGEPLILLNDYPAVGAVQGLAQAAAGGRILQAWGRVEKDAHLGPQLKLSGWQASVYPEQVVEGRLEREGKQAYLVSSETRYLFPDAPAEIPENALLTATGVQPDGAAPALEWYSLTEGPRQRVRAGGPGFRVVALNAENAPLPAAPLVAGHVDGALGTTQIIVHAFSDGSSQVEVQFIFAKEEEAGSGARARLDGSGLQGIDAYQNTPVRVWGQVDVTQGALPVIEVERFEPAYPDVSVQAWLGLAEAGVVDGQDVWLLTTPDDEIFVIASTLGGHAPAAPAEMLNDPVIVEGVQIPGRVLGDYAVIDDNVWLSGVGRNDLEGYQPASAQPRVVHEPGTAGERRTARIDTIELVYILTSADGSLAETLESAILAQPAYRFSGRLADGAYFEIYVQALLEV